MEEYHQQGRTDRLASLLEIAIQVRHTGICNVERGKGGVRQFGELIFLDGQLVDAIADSRIGIAAWEWLKTWSNCQYSFIVQNHEEIKISSQTHPALDVSSTTHSPMNLLSQMLEKVTHSLSGSLLSATPSPEISSSDDFLQKNTEQFSEPITPPSQMSPRSSLAPIQYSRSSMDDSPLNGAKNINESSPNSAKNINGPSPNSAKSINGFPPNAANSAKSINGSSPNAANGAKSINRNMYSQSMNYSDNQWNVLQPSQLPVQPLSPVPLRLIDGDDALRFIERYHLSRHHRHIFFLINGQRSMIDVARLTKRPLHEIQQTLVELEYYGLIQC
jgi:hypothetical protein